ncbi:MAG: [acyl-carrier-protein] S-malonyltransferase [Candidatus Omnitrophota bacterium]|nr:MAG: [acyl-carrier-protein] S-malonyltransferase [Candidatus Omnitrophota bacterium]
MVGYLFAGQGAQFVGMGKDLYGAFPQSKAVFDKADAVLGFSLSKICFEGPPEKLTKTNNCQPAILTMSIAAWQAYNSVANQESQALRYAAGLSLGEYSALVAAEALSFEDAVYLVRKRGEFMEEEAKKFPGSMASVIGLSLNEIKKICQQAKVEVANVNCPAQVVISGGRAEIEEAAKLAIQSGAKRVIPLEVSGAFHSSFMKGASLRLSRELEKIKINKPAFEVISNVTADAVSNPQEIKDNLIRQVANSVLWEDSMNLLLSKGVNNFIEFGPGKVLKGLMRRISEKAEVKNIEKSQDISNLENKEIKNAP